MSSARCSVPGTNYLLRVRATGLCGRKQVIYDGFAHFAQVMRGERELLGLEAHGGLKREHFCIAEHVRCVFEGLNEEDPGVDAEQFQMAFVLICFNCQTSSRAR